MRSILIGLLVLTNLVCAQSFKTTVAPLPDETLAGPCLYDLSLPARVARFGPCGSPSTADWTS